MNIEEIFKITLDCCFRVHSSLVPGLLESAYEEAVFYEMRKSGLFVEKQIPLPLIYKKVNLEIGYRIDLLVEIMIVVEIKTIEQLADIHLAQILTYLKRSGCKLGLLVNFNDLHLKEGIRPVIL